MTPHIAQKYSGRMCRLKSATSLVEVFRTIYSRAQPHYVLIAFPKDVDAKIRTLQLAALRRNGFEEQDNIVTVLNFKRGKFQVDKIQTHSSSQKPGE